MKPVFISWVLVASLGASFSALADDSSASSQPNPAPKKLTMKECMAQQKATNSSMTEVAMKTVCRNQMNAQKSIKNGNDLSTGPQNGNTPPKQ